MGSCQLPARGYRGEGVWAELGLHLELLPLCSLLPPPGPTSADKSDPWERQAEPLCRQAESPKVRLALSAES